MPELVPVALPNVLPCDMPLDRPSDSLSEIPALSLMVSLVPEVYDELSVMVVPLVRLRMLVVAT